MKKYDLEYEPLPVLWPKECTYSVKEYKGSTLKQGAALGLKYRLYVSGWTLKNHLERLLKAPRSLKRFTIYIAFKDQFPVGILLVIKNKYVAVKITVFTFVRSKLRKQGIGRLMIERLITDNPASTFRYMQGNNGSPKFYEKVFGDRGDHAFFLKTTCTPL